MHLCAPALAHASPVPAVQVHVAPVPVMLAPKQQVQVLVQVMAMAPFQGAPDLLLDYKMGATLVHQVRTAQ